VATVTGGDIFCELPKLKHTVFIELNQKAIVDVLYQDEDFKEFWGKRVLAIVGSKIRL
jgi:hypothetical protein